MFDKLHVHDFKTSYLFVGIGTQRYMYTKTAVFQKTSEVKLIMNLIPKVITHERN